MKTIVEVIEATDMTDTVVVYSDGSHTQYTEDGEIDYIPLQGGSYRTIFHF